MFTTKALYPGKYVIYKNGDNCELGRVSSIRDDTNAFIYYSEGDTPVLTAVSHLYIIDNDFLIEKTAIHGGKVTYLGRDVL